MLDTINIPSRLDLDTLNLSRVEHVLLQLQSKQLSMSKSSTTSQSPYKEHNHKGTRYNIE